MTTGWKNRATVMGIAAVCLVGQAVAAPELRVKWRAKTTDHVREPQAAALSPFAKRDRKARCAITVVQWRKTGEQQIIRFRSDLKSAKQCSTLAGMHRPNFDPATIDRKAVSYSWLGHSENQRQDSPTLTKRRKSPTPHEIAKRTRS